MGEWQARHGLSAADYQATFDDLGGQGYRLTDVSGYSADGRVRYAAIWERQTGPPWRARHGIPGSTYQQVFNQMSADGFRPTRLSWYATPAGTEVAGIWIADGVAEWQAHHGLDAAAFDDLTARLADDHYHLIDIAAYEEQGQGRFAGIWQRLAGARPEVRINRDASQHALDVAEMIGRRFVPLKIVGSAVQGAPRYASIWIDRPSRGWHARHGIDADEYQFTVDTYRYQAFAPRQVCGYATADGVRFTCLWDSFYYREVLAMIESLIQAYCVKYTVPGLSLAISREGRLVYARAFGYAQVWPITPLSVRHRMRIASVAKPITASAIMVLVERGQLMLNRRLFGANALFGFTYAPPPYDVNEVAIEVEHLLRHTSGFTATPTDPADEQPALNAHDLIGWTLNNRAPAAQPGAIFTYLNFGYLVAGRVIEHVTGQSYETSVKSAVLDPAGITSMTIGGDAASARQLDEVTYYAAPGDQDPYTVLMNRADAADGWIATAIDLLRFLRVVDGRGTDILSTASRATMSWPTAANLSYGLGWDISGAAGTWTHNGALPGSIAFLRLRHDGDGLAGLANTRQTGMQQGAMQNDLATLLESIRFMLIPTPTFDLFD